MPKSLLSWLDRATLLTLYILYFLFLKFPIPSEMLFNFCVNRLLCIYIFIFVYKKTFINLSTPLKHFFLYTKLSITVDLFIHSTHSNIIVLGNSSERIEKSLQPPALAQFYFTERQIPTKGTRSFQRVMHAIKTK